MVANEINLRPLYEIIRQELDIPTLEFKEDHVINNSVLSETLNTPRLCKIFDNAYIEITIMCEETYIIQFECNIHIVLDGTKLSKCFAIASYSNETWRYTEIE